MLDIIRAKWSKIGRERSNMGFRWDQRRMKIPCGSPVIRWNNMSIKRKLVFAFVMVGLFSAVVGVFGLGASYRANENTKDIYSGHFIPAVHLFGIQENLLKMNNYFLLMLYERDMLQTGSRIKAIRRPAE